MQHRYYYVYAHVAARLKLPWVCAAVTRLAFACMHACRLSALARSLQTTNDAGRKKCCCLSTRKMIGGVEKVSLKSAVELK